MENQTEKNVFNAERLDNRYKTDNDMIKCLVASLVVQYRSTQKNERWHKLNLFLADGVINTCQLPAASDRNLKISRSSSDLFYCK